MAMLFSAAFPALEAWEVGDVVVLAFRHPRDGGDAALTESERAVVEAILAGCSNEEIGRTRNRSPRTIANQIQSIYRKLGVGSRGELVAKLAQYR